MAASAGINYLPKVNLEDFYTVDRYSIGEGSQGKVFAAIERKTGKRVALKLVRINTYSEIPDVCITKNLTCKHVNKAIDFFYVSFRGEDRICIVMNLYDEEINHKLTESLISRGFEKQVKQIMYNLALAVKCCAENGVLHGDIKPQNIFINTIIDDNDRAGVDFQLDPDSVVLADFGLAQINLETSTSVLDEIYSLPYRPPEVFFNVGYNLKADVWALGCVFYELISDKRLFEPIEGMIGQILVKRGDPVKLFPEAGRINEDYLSDELLLTDKYIKKEWKEVDLYPNDNIFNDLLDNMLKLNPVNRYDIVDVLNHPYFDDIRTKEFDSDDINPAEIVGNKYRIRDDFDHPFGTPEKGNLTKRCEGVAYLVDLYRIYGGFIDILPHAITLYDMIAREFPERLTPPKDDPQYLPLLVMEISSIILYDVHGFELKSYLKLNNLSGNGISTQTVLQILKDIKCDIDFSTDINLVNWKCQVHGGLFAKKFSQALSIFGTLMYLDFDGTDVYTIAKWRDSRGLLQPRYVNILKLLYDKFSKGEKGELGEYQVVYAAYKRLYDGFDIYQELSNLIQ